VLSMGDVARLHLGHFTMPEDAGRYAGQKIVVCAYLLRHPKGLFLFDTGIGEGHEESDRIYRPVRRHVFDALAALGVDPGEVHLIANCHLHLDHSGKNALFPDTPIFAQDTEYRSAHEPDYTVPDAYDFPDARFELLDGEAEVLPGVRIIPTPGHTPGHQSLVVETSEGRLVIAGQAINFASEYAMAHYSWDLERSGSTDAAAYPGWIGRLQEFDPVRVVFAHDLAVWDRLPMGVDSPGDGDQG
jgi:N-acyl homoserine lactone hydrolase